MAGKLQQLLNLLSSKNEPGTKVEKQNQEIATTVLFLEMAYADSVLSAEEEQHIRSSVEGLFSLTADEVSGLIEAAREKRNERQDIWLFTDLIKRNFDRDAKKQIIDMLWELIYADGHMDTFEEALIRKITNLLGLSHGEMIQSKLKAKKNHGTDLA